MKQIFDRVKISMADFKGSALREKISLEKENITKSYPEVPMNSIVSYLIENNETLLEIDSNM